MPLGWIFWILFILCVIWYLPFNRYGTAYPWANWLVPMILIGLLGWATFGAMVKG